MTAVVLAPWFFRNEEEIGTATISTGSFATAVAGANCRATYSGGEIGWWNGRCADLPLGFEPISEQHSMSIVVHDGIHYATSHISRWPTVVLARITRIWGLFPGDQARLEAPESRNLQWQRLARITSLVILAIGLVGLRELARRRRPIGLLIGQLAMCTTIVILSYGNPRFRGPAECMLAITAATTISRQLDRRRFTRPH